MLTASLSDISEDVAAEDLVKWAKDPASKGLSPSYPVDLVSCGDNIEAMLYSKHGGHSGTLETILPAYKFHVESYQRSRRSQRESMVELKQYKSLKMLFIQWIMPSEIFVTPRSLLQLADSPLYLCTRRNAEFLQPTAWELLQPVIPTDENKVDINQIGAIFVTLQENNGRSESEHKSFLKRLVAGLNALSRHRTWNLESATFVELKNVIGTKPTAQGPKANHQAMYFVGRSHVPKAAIDECQWALNKREKGFVGISVAFADMGRVLVLGSHLPTSKENSKKVVQEMFDQMVTQCTPKEYRSEGLGYFGGGVYLLGDFNSRFSNESAQNMFEHLKDNSDYKDLYELPPPEAGATPEAQKLKHILDYDGSDKETRFAPLLWAVDTLGGSNEVEGTDGDIRTTFVNKGFGFTSTCYAGAYSYSWRKGCKLEKVPKLAELTKKCLNPKSERKPSDTGFLDRLVVRVVPESRSSSWKHHKHSSLPPVDAFITFSGQLMNLRSDHLPQVFVVQLLRVSRPRDRARSASPIAKLARRKARIYRSHSLDRSELDT
ncbi:hypothetical protein CSUI_007306 [Cystoisospora suis]|uniref:Uncharacterized protein n=1 Tax=Cystoisospora suis TaxID=483139 RepID=A0A2C6KRG1_9APIC|nr:hypothetical protein CSUI_007306 [Cystoisospora suis]